MKNNKSPTQLTHGEAAIRKAFRRSLLVMTLALVAAVLVYLLIRQPERTTVIPEAEIKAPDAPARALETRPPVVHFSDITEDAGIHFIHVNGAYGERLMPETIGSGAAFFDYDNDGDQDLFLVNFRYWPDHPGDVTPTQALYRNDGKGHFEDVSEAAGLDIEDYGMGVAVGDYDDDGWIDLFLSSLKKNRLFQNRQGRFHEVTDQAGVGGRPDRWSSSAAFLDYDRDGDLDLFVVNYVKWTRKADLEIDFRLAGGTRPDHSSGDGFPPARAAGHRPLAHRHLPTA